MRIDAARDMFQGNFLGLISVTQPPYHFSYQARAERWSTLARPLARHCFCSSFYNTSKATVNLLTDQLRIELRLFDANVILVVTGSMRIKFFQNLPGQTLSADSIYVPARRGIETTTSGQSRKGLALDADLYARIMGSNSLRRSPMVNG